MARPGDDPMARPGDDHFDARRHHRGIMRDVVLIAEQKLQRVSARREVDPCLGLPGSEMKVVKIVRYPSGGSGVSINRWWCPVFGFATPAGAMPMLARPK